ncbi:uncharacterized protein LOC117177166 [Belonocnema kinseyi]|uniref:uncharacterized protein LOC117177166 n=1 Tax=Belonocnema kinseyi TaxID=2817044 RepID=UPI00143D23CA|nr:uncharacterized protein LOC117177166 [Belonocnema kinseyi]
MEKELLKGLIVFEITVFWTNLLRLIVILLLIRLYFFIKILIKMSKQPFVSLLIICCVLSQGLVISSIENTGPSSLVIHQTRVAQLLHPESTRSSQQHQELIRSYQQHPELIRSHQQHPELIISHQQHPELIISHQQHPELIRSYQQPPELIRSYQQHPELIRSHQQHQSDVQTICRTRLQQLETPTSVSIRIDGIRVGLGTVVDSFIVATRASYFRNTTRAHASITFYSPLRRDYERRDVRHIEICRGIPGEHLVPHDVALVVVNQRILVHPDTDIMLQENFTPGEIMWIRGTVLTMVPSLRRRNHK